MKADILPILEFYEAPERGFVKIIWRAIKKVGVLSHFHVCTLYRLPPTFTRYVYVCVSFLLFA